MSKDGMAKDVAYARNTESGVTSRRDKKRVTHVEILMNVEV